MRGSCAPPPMDFPCVYRHNAVSKNELKLTAKKAKFPRPVQPHIRNFVQKLAKCAKKRNKFQAVFTRNIAEGVRGSCAPPSIDFPRVYRRVQHMNNLKFAWRFFQKLQLLQVQNLNNFSIFTRYYQIIYFARKTAEKVRTSCAHPSIDFQGVYLRKPTSK